MFFLRLFTSLAAVLGWASIVAAQSPRLAVVPRVGQTVRLLAQDHGRRLTGRVTRIGPDSLAVVLDRDTLVFPSRLLRTEGRVRTGSRPAAATGAYLGGAVGLLVGLIAASEEDCRNCWFDISPFAYAVGGIALGAGAGILVGSAFKQPIWTRATPPGAAAGPFNGSLGAGDVVRLIGRERRPIGIVTGGAGDTATVRLQSGTDTAVALGSLERYMGERLHRSKNMAYGAASGVVLGVLGSVAANNNDPEQVSAGQAIARTTLLAALGAGIGYLTGTRTRQAWAPVVPSHAPALSVTPVIGPGRVGAVARYAF